MAAAKAPSVGVDSMGASLPNFTWQQSMVRVKDPKASLGFYQAALGLTLVDKLCFPQWEFDVYFLMSLPKGQEYAFEPGSAEAHDFTFRSNGVCVELTHNYGTEDAEGQVYHAGNGERDGFGHLAVAVDDVYAACDELEAKGVTFKKKPDEGRMKGLAFAYDPDGYWVEIVSRGAAPAAPKFSLAQTMMRVKDPKKSVAFYVEQLGMTLVSERHFGDFSLFFLATLPDGVKGRPADPTSPEASAWVKEVLYPACVPVLELTHNHGTENEADFSYHTGNVEPHRGFGHIGFLVDSIEESCAALEAAGVPFQKKLGAGGMKNIAFALDPDGYWIEILPRGFSI